MDIQVDSEDQDLQIVGAYKTHPQSTTYYVYIKGSNKYFGDNAYLNFGAQ